MIIFYVRLGKVNVKKTCRVRIGSVRLVPPPKKGGLAIEKEIPALIYKSKGRGGVLVVAKQYIEKHQ